MSSSPSITFHPIGPRGQGGPNNFKTWSDAMIWIIRERFMGKHNDAHLWDVEEVKHEVDDSFAASYLPEFYARPGVYSGD